jgi:O-antigen ligase
MGFGVAEAVAVGCVALLSVALGWAVARYGDLASGVGSAPLLTLGALASLAVVMAGPVACLAAIAVLTVGAYGQPLGHVGTLSITPADVFYVGLVGWWLREVIGRAQQDHPDFRPRIAFGQSAALLFFGYTALTFVHVASADPGALGTSLVSWLKFVQSASIAFLAASLIKTERDVRLVLGAIVLAGVVAVGVAVSDGGNLLGGRSGGAVGPQPIGLLSGFILLTAAFGALTPKARYRIALAVVGVLGLLIAKSVASYVATGLALSIGAALMPPAAPAQRATRAVLAVGLAAVVIFGVVQVFRPEVTPGSEDFRNSSASHRILVMTAGLEIFERNPVIGAGWRQSSNPRLIGDRDVVTDVRRRFPAARAVHYPDISPTSVHNTYVQILADLGLVGFALFAALIAIIALRIRGLLRRMGPAHDLRREVWVMAMGLLLLLVWLNDKPLFGGQPESVFGALLVGTLAATARIVAQRDPVPRASVATAAGAVSGARAVGRAGTPLPRRAWPALRPGSGRRLALAVGIVVVAGVAGLLAGRWTADDGSNEAGSDRVERAVAAYGRTLNRDMQRLNATRTAQLERLREARTPKGQAAASDALARAHRRSARALARDPAPGALGRYEESVVEALSRIAAGYRRLTAAAATRDGAAYLSASRAVRRAEARLQRRLRQGQAGGVGLR